MVRVGASKRSNTARINIQYDVWINDGLQPAKKSHLQLQSLLTHRKPINWVRGVDDWLLLQQELGWWSHTKSRTRYEHSGCEIIKPTHDVLNSRGVNMGLWVQDKRRLISNSARLNKWPQNSLNTIDNLIQQFTDITQLCFPTHPELNFSRTFI